MKISKRVISLTLASLLLLSGCGTKEETVQTPKTAQTQEGMVQEETADSGEKQIIDIAVFEGGLGAEYWQEMMADYQKVNPNVEFKTTISPKVGEIIRPRIVAGDPPDFIVLTDTDQSGLMASLIKDRGLTDITDVFEGNAYEKEVPLKDYILDGFLDSKKYKPYDDGKIYLAPRDCGPTGLIYNKTLFEQNNWEVPETWDEFFSLGDKAKEKGIALMTYQGIYPDYLENLLIPAIANSVGQEGLEAIFQYREGSFNNEGVLKVLGQFEKIAKGGYLMEGTVALNHTQSQTDMMLGKALFIPNGSWMENEMKDSPREDGFKFAMMAAPVFNKGDARFAYSNYGQYAIPQGAKNPEGAKDFLRFLYSEESAKKMARYSNSVLAIDGGRELAKEFISEDVYNMFEVLEEATAVFPNFEPLPVGSKISLSDTIYGNGATKVMTEQATALEWAEIVEKAFAQIRDEKAKAE